MRLAMAGRLLLALLYLFLAAFSALFATSIFNRQVEGWSLFERDLGSRPSSALQRVNLIPMQPHAARLSRRVDLWPGISWLT